MSLVSYTKGNGPETIVFLHGFCENNTCFNEQVLFFCSHYEVITIDLPGFGKSETVSNISLVEMAKAVMELLQQKGKTKVYLFGHSMGGYVSLAFAKLFPEYLKGIGLIHSTPIADSEERKDKRKQVIKFLEKHDTEIYLKNFIPPLFTEDNAVKYATKFIEEGKKGPKEGIIEAVKAMMNREDNSELIEKLDIPFFWGIGKYDSLISENDLFTFAFKCKKPYIAYLKNSAHMSMVEEANELNKHIFQFIKLLGNS
jgi:pimeloyl-ACP methyl ester carboxylesterase